MEIYGYIRVSSTDQNESRQLDAMAHIPQGNLFVDKQSGKDTKRPELMRVMSIVKAGDTLIVESISRFARNTRIFGAVAELEREYILQRQAEGIAAAKKRGVQFGRPPKQPPDNFGELVRKWEKKEAMLPEILEELHISESTFYRRLREYRLIKGNKK